MRRGEWTALLAVIVCVAGVGLIMWLAVTYNPPPTRAYIPPPGKTATPCGAICEDGWRSEATGSGACSSHGGVERWLPCP